MDYSISLDPISKMVVRLKLYCNVKNVPELRQKIISGNLKCCLIRPSLILDPFQVIIAANKAVIADKLKTKSIYSEILFNLCISKNITRSLQIFGIEDEVTWILAVTLSDLGADTMSDQVFQQIQGQEVDIKHLSNLSNRNAIKKVYRISDVEFKEMNLLDSVISKIGAKDIFLK